MKKMITAILFLMLTLLFVGCGKADTSEVEIDYGTSSLYSKEEMDAAMKVIRKQFRSFEGCELHSLSYISDETCSDPDTLAWMNDLRTEKDEKSPLPNASHLTAASAHRKMAAAHGKRTKNTPGPGGWPGAKAENGSS